jgi:hypothetical protein
MTNNANQKRQPKGTSDGGKFAPDANPESTVVLDTEPILAMVVESVPSTKYHCDNCDEVSFEEIHDCGATCREIDPSDAESMDLDDGGDRTNVEMDGVVVASYRHVDIDHGHAADDDLINNEVDVIEQNEQFIADAQENVDLIFGRYHSRDVILNSDASEAFDSMELIVAKQKEIIDAQSKELEALRKDAGGFNLDRAIFDNVCATIEIRREHALGESSDGGVDIYELARLTDPEIEQVRALVDAHLENGISRGGDKAIGYLIEEETEYCMSEIGSKLGDILKEDE